MFENVLLFLDLPLYTCRRTTYEALGAIILMFKTVSVKLLRIKSYSKLLIANDENKTTNKKKRKE